MNDTVNNSRVDQKVKTDWFTLVFDNPTDMKIFWALLATFAHSCMEKGLCSAAFFFRFSEDEKEEIRLYFVASEDDAGKIESNARSHFSNRDSHLNFESKWIEKTSFKNENITKAVEQLLDYSSWTIANQLRNESEIGNVDSFAQAIQLAALLSETLGFTGKQVGILSFLCMADLFPLVGVERKDRKAFIQKFETMYARQEEQLRSILTKSSGADVTSTGWKDRIEEFKMQVRQANSDAGSLLSLYKQVVHYFNNQLGLRYADECYLHYIILKSQKMQSVGTDNIVQ